MTYPDDELEHLVAQWMKYDSNPETKAAIISLVEKEQWSILDSAMRPRISFGTAGLRAKMGPGFALMNDLTVLQASQGLAAYVKEQSPNELPSAVVGYDHRHHSKRFAQIAAEAFLNKGFKVYLFPDIVPTPLLAFSVIKLKTDIGVMITASHNPKSDNGYKVYWSNGAQIISPHDANILSSIQENLIPWPESSNCADILAPDTLSEYLNSLLSLRTHKKLPSALPVVLYTAMHGVGYSTVKKAIEICNLPNLIPVPSQIFPDPDFPTAPKPNPEEAGAFDEAIKIAAINNATVIFSNDPDADRFAIAEKLPNGSWKIFTGDEVGIILASYLVEDGVFSHHSNLAILNTVVSSSLLGHMVSNWNTYPKKNIQYAQCLTGFKNLVNTAQCFIKDNYQIALAYEEALGYMCGTSVMDKDGISALVVAYECLLHDFPLTFSQKLENIYQKHGYMSIFNDCYLATDPLTQITKAFSILSTKITPGLKITPTTIVDSVDDNSIKKIFSVSIKEPYPISICFRASGTEPKLKFYSQLGPISYISSEKQSIDIQLQHIVFLLINECLTPNEIGLYPSSKLEYAYISLQNQ